jgi:hypothetical protein
MLHLLCYRKIYEFICLTSLYCFLQHSLVDCTNTVSVLVAVELTRKINNCIIIVIINLENIYLLVKYSMWSTQPVYFMRYISWRMSCLIHLNLEETSVRCVSPWVNQTFTHDLNIRA